METDVLLTWPKQCFEWWAYVDPMLLQIIVRLPFKSFLRACSNIEIFIFSVHMMVHYENTENLYIIPTTRVDSLRLPSVLDWYKGRMLAVVIFARETTFLKALLDWKICWVNNMTWELYSVCVFSRKEQWGTRVNLGQRQHFIKYLIYNHFLRIKQINRYNVLSFN